MNDPVSGNVGPGARGARDLAVVSTALAVLYLWVPGLSPTFVSPNELSRILLTRAIVEEGGFAIDRGVERQGEVWSDLASYGGHYFSDKAPGLSFLAVPVLALLQPFGARAWGDVRVIYACRLATVTLPALAFLLWRYRRAESARKRGLWLAVGTGSLFFAQAFSFTAHLPAALLLLLAFERLRDGAAGRGAEAATGALLGGAILLDYLAALPVVVWLLFGLRRERRFRFWALHALGAALPLAVLAGYHAACFAGPFDLAYRHLVVAAHRAHREAGFFGASLPDPAALWQLTFGGQRGLFLHSPFLLATIPVAWKMSRRGSKRRAEALALVAAAALLLLFDAALVDWQGGWSLGPRYLALALAPLLLLLEETTPGRGSWWLAAAIGWSVALHVGSVATFPLAPFGPALLFPALELASFLGVHGLVAWNWGVLFGLGGLVTLLPLFLAGAALLAGRERRRYAIAALGGALLLVAVAWGLAQLRSPEGTQLLETFPARLGYRLESR